MRNGTFLCGLLMVGFAGAAAARQATELSLEQALSRLDEVSESVRVAAAAVDRARGQETQARSGAIARITCGCDFFVTADFDFGIMVQVNR